MYNEGILQIIRESEQFHQISAGLRQGLAEMQLYGLPEGLKGLWLASMLLDTHPIMVVTVGSDDAQRLAADMESFWPGEGIAYLPAPELLPVDINAYSPELTAQTVAGLE